MTERVWSIIEGEQVTDEQLKVLSEWEEGGPSWYRAECFKGTKSNEFDLLKALAVELIAFRAEGDV